MRIRSIAKKIISKSPSLYSSIHTQNFERTHKQDFTKVKDKEKKIEYDILSLCKTHLEDGKSLRSLDLEANQIKWIKHLNLITLKPLIYVANIDESLISDDNEHVLKLSSIVSSYIKLLDSNYKYKYGSEYLSLWIFMF